ncbi:hypothetical protein [Chitinophaga vietnamensis]|uniref:hypothetical protein n=1 Tax=Chitinophaga vietnamensis TaxID=2593957 RepID=UPI001177DBBA|nr:hypothetical protein [Chitinophaga vietnamensis]
MRRFRLYLLCFLALATSAAAQQRGLPSDEISRQLGEWQKTYFNFNLKDFKTETAIRFEDIPFGTAAGLRNFYDIYKPALSFSPDGRQFIDIYSYWLVLEKTGDKIVYNGGNQEQAVSWYDDNTRRWKRILNVPAGDRVEEVAWLDSTHILLAGSRRAADNDAHPLLWLGDLRSRRFIIFANKNPACRQDKKGYDSPKLKALHIVIK